jgi:hypothetical protein
VYPSGPWRGYWEQALFGRQSMGDLVLHFEGTEVTGHGHDIVGPFTFTGSCDDRGNVVLVKQYLGRHKVLYRGTYDGEGTILGRWSIGATWTGPFALSPVRGRPAADAPIQEIG